MDYEVDAGFADEEKHARRRRTAIQLAAALLVLIGAIGGLYLYHDHYGISSDERFEREVAADQAIGSVLVPLRNDFPYEYGKLRKQTVESYNLEKVGKVLDHLPHEFFEGFLKRHAVEAIQGGDKESLGFLSAYAAFFDKAERDAKLCDVIFGSDDKGRDPAIMLRIPQYDAMYRAFIALAASGRKHPVQRAAPTVEERIAVGNEARRLLPNLPSEWPLKPIDRCRQANAAAKAIRSRPEDQQIRLISILFQGWR